VVLSEPAQLGKRQIIALGEWLLPGGLYENGERRARLSLCGEVRGGAVDGPTV